MRSITDHERGYIEGFAAALQAIEMAITGDCGCNKSYDPMTIEGATMHSYAFDMKDGGRHHSLEPYETARDICEVLFRESLDNLREEEVPVAKSAELDWFLGRLPARRTKTLSHG